MNRAKPVIAEASAGASHTAAISGIARHAPSGAPGAVNRVSSSYNLQVIQKNAVFQCRRFLKESALKHDISEDRSGDGTHAGRLKK